MPARAALLFLCALLSILPCGSASEDLPALLKKAGEAMDRKDRKRADFYAARYLGFCSESLGAGCDEAGLQAFLKKRQLEPKAFLYGDPEDAFLEWFERSIRRRWAAPDERVREKYRTVEIAQNTYQKKYFVTVVAYPELELWHVLKDGIISRPMVLPMGSFRDRPTIFFGKLLKGASFQSTPYYLDTQKRTLHYLWQPEFFDRDKDGIPEIWLRYNLGWGNNFIQVMDVYKIEDDRRIKLLSRFQSAPGGSVRRLPNGKVEKSASPSAD